MTILGIMVVDGLIVGREYQKDMVCSVAVSHRFFALIIVVLLMFDSVVFHPPADG